jgi:[ribosomal protein S5]-alanine N-acetyltransferase
MKILTTERLFLRTWEETDFSSAQSLWGDPDVMTFLGGPLDDKRLREKFDFEIACQEKHGTQYWPMFEIQSGEFVGCCGLRPWAYSPPEGYELGFHLVKAKWRNGYAFEAAQGIVRHAFERLQFPVLRAGHHPDHVTSKTILLKLEFEFVDEVFYKPTGFMHPTYALRRPP